MRKTIILSRTTLQFSENMDLFVPQLKVVRQTVNDTTYYKKCIFKYFSIKLDEKNNYILLKNSSALKVNEILKNRDGIYFTGNVVNLKENVFNMNLYTRKELANFVVYFGFFLYDFI